MSVFRDISHAIGAARNGWAHRPSLVTRADEFRGMQQAAYRTAIEAAFKSRRAKNEWYPGGDGEANVGNYYPGAELGRYRNDWITRIVTSTNLTRLSYRTLCSRSEHAYRTNSNIKRAIELIKTLTIGSGALPFAMVKNGDGTPAEAINKALTEAIWPRFNDQGMRVGSQDLSVLEGQGIEMESMAQLGSVIRQKKPSKKGSCIPFAYTWAKPYRLNFAHDNFFDDLYYRELIMSKDQPDITVLGQKFNKNMEPLGFYILGENDMVPATQMSIHYRQREPEQYLGFPWVAASLPHAFDVDQLIDDIMSQSRALARLGFRISKKDGGAFVSDLSFGGPGDGENAPSVELPKFGAISTDEKPETLMFDNNLNDSMVPLIKLELAELAVGMGISYQLLSSDLTVSSYSGNRMNSIIDSKCLKSIFGSFVRSNCQTVWADMVEWAVMAGKVPGVSYTDFLRDPWQFTRCYWLPEPIDWFDQLEKIKAQRFQLQTGMITLQELCESEGRNWKDVIMQRSTEKDFIKKYDLAELLCTYSEHVTPAAAAETEQLDVTTGTLIEDPDNGGSAGSKQADKNNGGNNGK